MRPLIKAFAMFTVVLLSVIVGTWVGGWNSSASVQQVIPPPQADRCLVDVAEAWIAEVSGREAFERRAAAAEAVYYMAICAEDELMEARAAGYCTDPETFYRAKCGAFRWLRDSLRLTTDAIRRGP